MIKVLVGTLTLGLNFAFAFEDDAGLHHYDPVNSNLPVVPVNFQEQKTIKKGQTPMLQDADDENLFDRNYETEEPLVPGETHSFFQH